ncbi:hypothetical protein ACG02S_05580 [Roseateles sp. DC23W]|uniref:Uncharacterized protein n=1 Tax=Pelomonas dachongensis TaxID=3299029 RepID=A0ABW7EIU4_9BURK
MRAAESVFFRISRKGANACSVPHTGTRNDYDCSGGQSYCSPAERPVVKAVWLPQCLPVTLRSNAETLKLQQRQGLVTQTVNIKLKLNSGAAVRHGVAITGRVRSCACGDQLGGLPRCARIRIPQSGWAPTSGRS